MILVGLTGGIASGKSTVGRLLRSAGVDVIDADALARDAVAVGSAGLAAVVARFGNGVVGSDGNLDRKALGAVVFADSGARADLNAIVHPEVARLAAARLEALRDQGRAVAVYEVPLLFENGLESMMDATILVACPEDVQIQRIKDRDHLSDDEARARIAAQMPLAEKRARAQHVIENDGDLDALADNLAEVWRSVTGVKLGADAPGTDRAW
jgi:dephospho-CoA kinase